MEHPKVVVTIKQPSAGSVSWFDLFLWRKLADKIKNKL